MYYLILRDMSMSSFRISAALRLLSVIMMMTVAAACTERLNDYPGPPGTVGTNPGDRTVMEYNRNVFLIYSIGFNNLSSFLKEDIADIEESRVPTAFDYDDVLLVFSHSTKGSYRNPNPPALFRIYRDWKGNTVRDTLMVMDESTVSASAQTVNDVLTYVRDNFPANRYGMLMSSHATGWVPAGYTSKGNEMEEGKWPSSFGSTPGPVPFSEKIQTAGMPMVKSFGSQSVADSLAYEINIDDLADAIPMKLDYILFDACFMGGIEVAYELKDVCDRIVFSQAEIMADGMDYTTMTSYLFKGREPDLIGFSENYYRYYDSYDQPGEEADRSATISLVDCRELDLLAETCREIFSSNRAGIASLEGSYRVQKYFRSSSHKWFYDLEHIVELCGSTEEQKARLKEALDRCVIYKAATEEFMCDIQIKNHCGLSMYLPYRGLDYLNSYYRKLEWNRATGLVE